MAHYKPYEKDYRYAVSKMYCLIYFFYQSCIWLLTFIKILWNNVIEVIFLLSNRAQRRVQGEDVFGNKIKVLSPALRNYAGKIVSFLFLFFIVNI